MRKRWLSMLLAGLLCCIGCIGCASTEPASSSDPMPESSQEASSEEAASASSDEQEEPVPDRQVIVYFANWNLDDGGEVASIPWEDVTCINHAFWEVAPADGTTETTLEWKEKGEAPRTQFALTTSQKDSDLENDQPSELLAGCAKNHFAQYAVMSEQYPDVNILISIGGWTKCGYFSEMAYTKEGRASIVQSCMELLEQYPWLDGFDFDWEYFGGSGTGEGRLPEDETDQGCPIWGTSAEDSENFAALLSELREEMEKKYGENGKLLTACASASTSWTLPCQNWEIVHPYLDYVNLMTYDMAGTWEGIAGHQSKLRQVDDAVFALHIGNKVPYSKICIGSPMYGIDLLLKEIPTAADSVVGKAIENYRPAAISMTQTVLKGWEVEAVSGYEIIWEDGKAKMGETFDNGGVGWHYAYDSFNRANYLYNDDPESEYCRWYISYENALTLQDKLDYILDNSLAGLIVWETSQDTSDHALIGQMADCLLD